MEEGEKKLVKCVNCGNVWETKAKRPQCSICKSTRVEYVNSTVDQHVDSDVDLDVESTKDVDDFFELDDVDVDELLNENEGDKQESKQESKGKKALRKIGFKIHKGILLIGFAVFFVLVLLKGLMGRRGRRQAVEIVEDGEIPAGANPYSALG